jgi:hypothetical protein
MNHETLGVALAALLAVVSTALLVVLAWLGTSVLLSRLRTRRHVRAVLRNTCKNVSKQTMAAVASSLRKDAP